MSETAIEDHLYDFLAPVIAAAQDDEEHVFYGVVLHDTIYRLIDESEEIGDFIQIGNCDSDFAPSPGAETIEEFDGDVTIITLSRVTSDDRSVRAAARGRALELAKAVAKLFLEDPTAGGRVNDVRVLRCLRDWTSINSNPYAITNVPLLVNETGGSYG